MKEKMQQLLDEIKKNLIFLSNEVEHSIKQSIKAVIKQDKEI